MTMMLRNPLLVLLVGASCVIAEPIGDEPATEGSASQSSGSGGDGHTGMSNVDDGAASIPTGAEEGDDSVSGTATSGNATSATATDPSGTASASATATVTAGDTGDSSLLEQCGIELPETPDCPSDHEAQCGCDSCNLQWYDLDQATVNAIIAECACLCEAAGCGFSASGGADAGSYEGCDTDGGGETSSGDTEFGTASASSSATSAG